MLKRPVLVHRCLQTSVKRFYHLNVLEHLGNKVIYKPLSQPSQKPKKIEDGSIGVIQIIKNEYNALTNPMHRRFLDDLEEQKDQRNNLNRSLKEKKGDDLQKMAKGCQKLVKEITMKGNDGDAKKLCKELAQKEKSDKEKIKKRCRELAAKEKCEKDKLKKQCKELLEKGKCKKKETCEEEEEEEEEDPCVKCCCPKKRKKVDPCKKKDPCKKEDPCKKKTVDWKKKCMEVAKREQCKKLAEKKKFKKMIKMCKMQAEKDKCRKMAEKEKCRKKAKKGKKDK
ncbi:sperm-specific protein Don juan [Drosophila santomea]|uniref:sperm-specific protein Don juan n=1 Tax=Drosophila santomea TaxID=129105 RepID=UPI001953E644|nr:sperm-specific protein Don juan [Drosophila santomea]